MEILLEGAAKTRHDVVEATVDQFLDEAAQGSAGLGFEWGLDVKVGSPAGVSGVYSSFSVGLFTLIDKFQPGSFAEKGVLARFERPSSILHRLV